MRRTHTFEFEDLPSLPGWLRDSITRLIVVFARLVGATDALAVLVGRVCHEQQVKLEDAPAGLKVMANSFHHLRPEDARSVLASAQASGEPIVIYELSDNKIPFLAWCAGLPVGLPLVFLFALLLTPWARPRSLRQLFFTYLIPIIPALYAWDGQASMPRIYGLKDLDELLDGLGTDGYAWEKGVARTDSGRAAGIYLLGAPLRPKLPV